MLRQPPAGKQPEPTCTTADHMALDRTLCRRCVRSGAGRLSETRYEPRRRTHDRFRFGERHLIAMLVHQRGRDFEASCW